MSPISLSDTIDVFLSDPRIEAHLKPDTLNAHGPTTTPKSLRVYLREHTSKPDYAPLLRSKRGTRLSYDTLHYQWSQACAAVGLSNDAGKSRYTLHQLRHTRATELVKQG